MRLLFISGSVGLGHVVRDLAVKAGKQVQLEMSGEDTELDRNVVEQISDPLVHMIRNAVDHGIEPREQRRIAGKPDDGRLLLRAYHQGGSIVIEIADDGRGIDKAKILAKAIEKGVLPPETKLADLGDQEAYGIIFLPGFSTAEKVTDLSGRGVGMGVPAESPGNPGYSPQSCPPTRGASHPGDQSRYKRSIKR